MLASNNSAEKKENILKAVGDALGDKKLDAIVCIADAVYIYPSTFRNSSLSFLLFWIVLVVVVVVLNNNKFCNLF